MQKLTDKQKQAMEMRLSGMSLKDIANKIGVAKSSVSVWTRGIKVTIKRKGALGANANKVKGEKQRLKYQDEGKIAASYNEALHIKGCMLYWAEGDKDKNMCRLVNTDLHILQIFLEFLKRYFSISDSDIKLDIYSYLNNNLTQEDIKNYWIESLSLNECEINRLVFHHKQPVPGKEGKHKHPYGLCRITIKSSTRIVQHIYGAIQFYAGFNNQYGLY